MDPITAIAASGLRARMESLDMLANNIANASTGGYKADREFYSLYMAPEAEDAGESSVMPLIERPWTDLSQGAIQVTGNSLDVALSGKGFFAVNGPGGTLYTRNGSFTTSASGNIVTADGYPVRGTDGAALTLDASLPVRVSEDGTVQQDASVVGQMEVVDFADAGALGKQGANYFTAGPAAVRTAVSTGVEQGKLEASNTGAADAAVRLISVMRQFEMMQKAASLADTMSQRAIDDVAKVGS
jgi:flagellar basal-body rod protein FlgF